MDNAEKSNSAEMPDPGVRSVRGRVCESAIQKLSANDSLDLQLLEKLRDLLVQEKPAKAEAYVTLFLRHAEGTPK